MNGLNRVSADVLAIESINSAVRVFSHVFAAAGPVLEIGSYYPPGFEELCDRRKLFPGREYLGCDLRRGAGVDRLEDAQSLSFRDASFSTMIMLEILEHLPNPERAISEARRVLRDDGLLIASVPFSYRLHGFPTDYWRFTSSGLYEMLEEFPQKLVFAIGPGAKPATVFAVARKTESEDFMITRERFEAAMQDESMTLRRRLFFAALQERSKDLFGLLLGRANVSITFYDPAQSGGYTLERPQQPHVETRKADC